MAQLSPAFQFYFKDWRSSRKVQRMSFKERGMYLEMLIDQWDSGPLPHDPAAIAALIGAKEREFMTSWPTIQACFVEHGNGWVNLRLEREREKQHVRNQRASDQGKHGATKRWGGHATENSHGIGAGIATASEPDSFSIAIASANAIAGALASAGDAPAGSARAIVPEGDVGERGRRLLESYPAWYAQERHGARLKLLTGPIVWQDACVLCQTWDDARLEKLARIVLSTDDDPFIVKSDRGFKIFCLKASWADDRLKQWELEHGVTV